MECSPIIDTPKVKEEATLHNQPHNEAAIKLQASLEQYDIRRWGFVIYRCTYSSQEKWDKFMGLVKKHARDYFEEWRMDHVYDSLSWTIIEDADNLDGADIVKTSRRFKDWADSQGKQEMEGSEFSNTWGCWPRCNYFMHVDEESLESVVDAAKAKDMCGYFCKVVRADMVLMREEDRAAGEHIECEEEDEWEIDYEERDYRKRVKIDSLVDLYCYLLDGDEWYNLYVDKGIVQYI